MAYTNVWTVAAPLDTQAANQGAVDFRATKLDIMQRVASFGAGLLVNRPTPEATSASANWTGVMYWTTDTQQTFRWNGASWDDITATISASTFVFSNAPAIIVPADTNEDIIYTATVLANSMGASGGVIVEFVANITSSTGNITVRVKLGASTIVAFTLPTAGFGAMHKLRVIILNATALTQVNSFEDLVSAGNPVIGSAASGVDTTVNQTLSVTVQKTNAGDIIALQSGYAKLL